MRWADCTGIVICTRVTASGITVSVVTQIEQDSNYYLLQLLIIYPLRHIIAAQGRQVNIIIIAGVEALAQGGIEAYS